MPNNQEGEFELVLGNRQLIGVFLIVVVLLGAFFSMGYIVGRNSPAAAAETARNEKPKAEHVADSSDSVRPGGAPDQPVTSAEGNPGAASDPTPPSAPPEIARAETHSKAVKPKPSPVSPSAGPSAPAAARASLAGEPAGGQYWQVVATARPDAEIIAEALGKKGFHTVLAPAPKDGVFRVLVGPLADASTQAQIRTNLESAGFKNPIMRKY